MKNQRIFLLALGTLLSGLLPLARAQSPQSGGARYFTETELVDQDGRTVHFYSDVLKGRTAVINVFYTAEAESATSRQLKVVQRHLSDRVGRDIILVSVTLDPETDTAGKLKGYATKFEAGPGWIFLTGRKENIQTVLNKLGLNVVNKADHPNSVLVGNEATDLWKRAFGSSSEDLLRMVISVANDPLPGRPGPR